MVQIFAQDGGDEYCQQGEYGEDATCRLLHEAHIAVGDKSQNAETQQSVLLVLGFLEVASKTSGCHKEHQSVLDIGDRVGSPERICIRGYQCQVALQHVHGIFLEGENSAVIKYAEQSYQPETTRGENLSEVADFEGVVLLFCLTSLCVELLVHDEVNDGHDECNAHQYDTKGY